MSFYSFYLETNMNFLPLYSDPDFKPFKPRMTEDNEKRRKLETHLARSTKVVPSL
jgi:hypothetical protein